MAYRTLPFAPTAATLRPRKWCTRTGGWMATALIVKRSSASAGDAARVQVFGVDLCENWSAARYVSPFRRSSPTLETCVLLRLSWRRLVSPSRCSTPASVTSVPLSSNRLRLVRPARRMPHHSVKWTIAVASSAGPFSHAFMTPSVFAIWYPVR